MYGRSKYFCSIRFIVLNRKANFLQYYKSERKQEISSISAKIAKRKYCRKMKPQEVKDTKRKNAYTHVYLTCKRMNTINVPIITQFIHKYDEFCKYSIELNEKHIQCIGTYNVHQFRACIMYLCGCLPVWVTEFFVVVAEKNTPKIDLYAVVYFPIVVF